MDAVLEAASYSRGGFSTCLDSSVRSVMVPDGSTSHLEPGTIQMTLPLQEIWVSSLQICKCVTSN